MSKRLLLLLLAALICLTGCSQDYSRAYDKAVKLFANGDYAEAVKAFDRLNGYSQSATYAAYSQGLVLYEQGQYAAAAPYFEQTQDFMYGAERFRYCRGYALLADGQFAEAASAFRALQDFEDGSLWYEYCTARAAEEAKDYETALYAYEAAGTLEDAEDRLYNLRGQIYNRAIALKQEGRYTEATPLFIMLGDYLSAAAQASECKEYALDEQYAQAESLEESGDLQAAFELFFALSSHRDAADRAQALADRLGIDLPNEKPLY